jgi:uncharacterized membrane protein
MSKKKKSHKAMQETRENKKAAVLGNPNKSKLPVMVILAAIMIAGGGVIGLMQYQKAGPASGLGTGKAPQAVNASTVAYPVSLFDDGQARHYSFKAGNETIRYFVLKSTDGVVRAAFDACDVCWPAGKGYYQEGDVMVCRNCGRRFASNRINEVKGGCNPAPLNRSVEGEQLVIKIDDILEGKSYFNFSGRG